MINRATARDSAHHVNSLLCGVGGFDLGVSVLVFADAVNFTEYETDFPGAAFTAISFFSGVHPPSGKKRMVPFSSFLNGFATWKLTF